MGALFYNIMKSILGTRNSHFLTESEAQDVVNKFYDAVSICTSSCTNKARVEWFEKATLKNFGLERFAI